MPEPIAVPSRFWWLKRLVGCAIMTVALLVGLRVWWGWIAQSRLDAEINAAKLRGEPVLAEDFENVNPPPHGENAAAQLEAAAAAISYNEAQRDLEDRFSLEKPLSPSDRQVLAGMVGANAKAIELARRAVELPKVDWGVRFDSSGGPVSFNYLNGQRELANLFLYAALNNHLHDNDSQTLEDAKLLINQADLLDRDHPLLPDYLTAFGISAAGEDVIFRFAGQIQIRATNVTAHLGAAPPSQLRSLIAQLLDERDYTHGCITAWYSERLLEISAVKQGGPLYGDFGPGGLLLWKPLQPLFILDCVRQMQQHTAVAHALALPTYADAQRALPVPAARQPGLRSTVYIFSQTRMDFGRTVRVYYEGLAMRRIAATLLAIRLFEVENGHLPPDLQSLVPNYVPAVPADPFAPGSHSLRYISVPGHEAIYSVGIDGIDDGGSRALSSGGDTKDLVVPFQPPLPVLPGATQNGE